MKSILALFTLFCLTAIQASAQDGPSIQAYFSPNGGCQQAIIGEINNAHQEILIQAYEFTDHYIGKSLVEAARRNVRIIALVDKVNQSGNTAQYSVCPELAEAGVKVLVDAQPPIAHSKVMIIDRFTLITGSYNFTKAANLDNVENLLIIKNSPSTINAYIADMKQRVPLCQPFQIQ